MLISMTKDAFGRGIVTKQGNSVTKGASKVGIVTKPGNSVTKGIV